MRNISGTFGARTASIPPMRLLLAIGLSGLLGCASSVRPQPTTPDSRAHRSVRGEEFRVLGASPAGAGDAFDATLLFERGIAHMRQQRCAEALTELDRLVREFPSASVVPLAQYNRGLCLQRAQRWPDAAAAMTAAATTRDADLAHDALFRLAAVGASGASPAWVLEATDALQSRSLPMTITDRVELSARRASARLAENNLEEAEREAQRAVAIAPTEDAVHALDDDTYAAEARVVLGEVTRRRASAVAYRVEAPDAEAAITRRVNLVTHAHLQFNDAIRAGNPDWAAAAGFRIGEMYRDLYDAIVDAPTPTEWDDDQRRVYRARTAERLRPLLQGALRSWELTLTMARRTGITNNEWVRRASEAIDRLRAVVAGGA
ncbi:MAG: tetratricopeptide repeat protein [Deltaproteobacteria bacterium]|nr:tetratricopeptide repeat protein [Deltaproteobacteria bacterium]